MATKIYNKKSIGAVMHVIECPKCKNICASASERAWLPEWSTCDQCDTVEKIKTSKQ